MAEEKKVKKDHGKWFREMRSELKKVVCNVELAEAGQHERMLLAQALWYLKHDLSDEAREQDYLSCMDTLRGGGFSDETERLAERLTDSSK